MRGAGELFNRVDRRAGSRVQLTQTDPAENGRLALLPQRRPARFNSILQQQKRWGKA
jgi:hypothetical protein